MKHLKIKQKNKKKRLPILFETAAILLGSELTGKGVLREQVKIFNAAPSFK